MKRFRDYKIIVPDFDTAMNMLKKIEGKATSLGLTACDKGDNKGVSSYYASYIICKGDFPRTKLFLSAYESENNWEIAIVNIIPTTDSGLSCLGKNTYNKILQYFVDDVLTPVSGGQYKITTNEEDYTLQSLIPLSWKTFNRWIDSYPLSHHPNDEARWLDFVISLYKNNENLSIEDFEEWIREDKKWEYKDIEYFSSRLEYGVELLKKYDERDGY